MKKINLISAAAALLMSCVFILCIWILYNVKQPINQSLLLSHVTAFDVKSTKLQLITYVGSVSMLAIACLFLLLNPKFKILIKKQPSTLSILLILVLIFVAPFPVGEYTKWFRNGFFSTFLVLLLAVKLSKRPFVKLNYLYYLFVALTLIYLAFYFVLPFFTPLIVTSGAGFTSIESHYAMTVLSGFDFVCCEKTGVVEQSKYGLSIFMLSALAYKIASLFDAHNTQLIFIVRGYQIIAACLLVFAVFILNKKHFLLISALALTVTASLNTMSVVISYPNQSGMRYIPFLIGLILLAWETQRKSPRISFLATASALLIILNPETGIALSCGFAVFLVLRKYKPESAYATTFKTVGIFSVLTIFLVVPLSVLSADNFYSDSSADLFSNIKLFSSGFGLVRKPHVIAIFIIFFAVFALVRGVLRARNGNGSSVDAYQAGIGTIMLTWLPYYVNRAGEANLWFQAVLILLLFAPRIGFSSLRILSGKFQFGVFYTGLAISFMGALLFWSSEQNFWKGSSYYYLDKSSCFESPEYLKGFCFVGSEGPGISKQLGFLKGLTEKRDFLVISHLSTQVRLIGFNEGFPWYEPFGEIPRDRDMNSLLNWIETKGPRYVVTDDPASAISKKMPNRTQHLQHIVNSLDSYHKHKINSGWVIYERISSKLLKKS